MDAFANELIINMKLLQHQKWIFISHYVKTIGSIIGFILRYYATLYPHLLYLNSKSYFLRNLPIQKASAFELSKQTIRALLNCKEENEKLQTMPIYKANIGH